MIIKMDEYLYKNGDMYKVVYHWDEESTIGGFVSVFLQEFTRKLICNPLLYEENRNLDLLGFLF